MKMLRAVATLALLLVCAPALAQQTAVHSVVIGKGAGNTGFNAAVPGTTGQPLVSQGATTDPAFGTIANSGFTAGPADTYKGSLNGGSVADVALPNCQSANTALRYVAGSGPICGNVSVTTGYDMPINLGLSVPAPSGNALVISLTQANGSAPGSSNPVLVPFRSTSLATGTVTWTTISATQSITIPSGATLGTSNGVPFRVWIFEDYNGGAPELGVATCSNSTTIFGCAAWESTLPTSTTIGGSSGTSGVLYSTTGVTADAVRIIGYCEFSSGLTTAGAWASSCTTLQVFGPGVSKPGSPTGNEIYLNTASSTTCGTSELETAVASSITPTSAANLIEVFAQLGISSAAAGDRNAFLLSRNGGSSAIGQGATIGAAGSATVPFGSPTLLALDAPGVAAAQAYAVYCITNTGSGSSAGGVMLLKEIMG